MTTTTLQHAAPHSPQITLRSSGHSTPNRSNTPIRARRVVRAKSDFSTSAEDLSDLRSESFNGLSTDHHPPVTRRARRLSVTTFATSDPEEEPERRVRSSMPAAVPVGLLLTPEPRDPGSTIAQELLCPAEEVAVVTYDATVEEAWSRCTSSRSVRAVAVVHQPGLAALAPEVHVLDVKSVERLHRYSHSPSSESLQACLRGVPASPCIAPGTPAHVAAGVMLAPDAAAKQLAYLPVMLDGTFVGLLSRSSLSDLMLGPYKGLYGHVAAPRPSDAGSVSFGGVLPGRESVTLESAPTLSAGLDDLLPLPCLSLKLPDHHHHEHHHHHESSSSPPAAAAGAGATGAAASSAAPDPHAHFTLLHQPQGTSISPLDLGLGLGALLGCAAAGDLQAAGSRPAPASVPLPPVSDHRPPSGHAHAQFVLAHHRGSAAAAAAATPPTPPPSHAQLEELLPLHMQLQSTFLEQQAVAAAVAAGLALPAVSGAPAAVAAAASHPLSGPPRPSLDLDAGLQGDVLPMSQSPREWGAAGQLQQQQQHEQNQQSQQNQGGHGHGGSHGGGGSGQPGSPAVQHHAHHQAHGSTATTSVAQASMDAEHGVHDVIGRSGWDLLDNVDDAMDVLGLVGKSMNVEAVGRQLLGEVTGAAANLAGGTSGAGWAFKYLYDGDCSICRTFQAMVEKLDNGLGRVAFVDIANQGYNALEHGGINVKAAMETVHILSANGQVVKGVTAVIKLLAAVDAEWAARLGSLPAVLPLVSLSYMLLAKHRHQLAAAWSHVLKTTHVDRAVFGRDLWAQPDRGEQAGGGGGEGGVEGGDGGPVGMGGSRLGGTGGRGMQARAAGAAR